MDNATRARLIERLRTVPAANIGDGMERLGLLDSSVHSVWPGARVVGPAFTVWTRSGDNLFIHKALDECNPGDVIVVNGHGDLSRALIGELIGARAAAKGIAGFVIDGAVRDAEGLQGYGMPVFARAITPAGPYKFGPGRLQVPIAVGGVAVLPGDLIVGDGDGVAVIPTAMAEAVTEAAEAVQIDEAERRQRYESGIPAAAGERR
ncbi:methyltransferase [Mycolicibacterium sp. 018/SC-01/001]|uniref:RraA family protein n=1 Tax=Mycolicibacterium sp. 018/SC-01/001 TaxID=2592069 RepID=UPI00117D6098|nr:methyltransferase [Mycolicibacterium sp. 018/SC-01/001]TRW80953.1 methyltransferase [Mycolicibacterium sp. 018/SC-01/001]